MADGLTPQGIDLVGRTRWVVVLRLQVQRGVVTWQMGMERRGICVRGVVTPPLLWWVAGMDVAVPHRNSGCPLATETSIWPSNYQPNMQMNTMTMAGFGILYCT